MSSEHGKDGEEDLDGFLIEVESKLRAPFSSLDLAKAVTASALKTSSPQRYLQLISKVFPKMDKVVQLRVLVGLLGLEPSPETNEVVFDNVLSHEMADQHEEWVRIVGGLVKGIMFYDPDTKEACRGEEARELLQETCRDIVEQVKKHAAETERKSQADGASSLWTADMHPLYNPYRYSLLDPEELRRVLPECDSNPHFTVNEDADILKVDANLENARAQEEQKEAAQKKSRATAASLAASKSTAPKKPDGAMAANKVNKPNTTTNRPRPAAPKSSMFLKSKKPTLGVQGRKFANMRKTQVRAKGSAQALVAKRRPGTASASLGRSSQGGGGATVSGAMKYGNAKSKMKMIDVSEVQGLTKEHKERHQEAKMSARKRQNVEKAKGIKKQKLNDNNEEGTNEARPAAPIESGQGPQQPPGALKATAAAALLAYQQQTGTAAPAANGTGAEAGSRPAVEPTANIPAPGPAPQKQDWHKLLEKSNKLSAADRERVKQFFADKVNPTPDQPIYKMKLHEEKTTDPAGHTVKETLYLELDYNTFGFKMLRKKKVK